MSEPVFYLDAIDTASGAVLQVEIDQSSAARERRRGLFSVSDEPRVGCPLRARRLYGWTPVKRDD